MKTATSLSVNRSEPSILFIATIDSTIWSFLMPYMRALRQQGWLVEAAACPTGCAEQIEAEGFVFHPVSFARSPLRLANIKGTRQLLQLLRRGPFDIVHVHTPVAGFFGRWAAHEARTPCVIYTAHGFHFHEHGGRISNAIFLAAERMAARWTDILVTINRNDYDVAQLKMSGHGLRIRYVPGVGLDLQQYDSSLPTRTSLHEHGIQVTPDQCVVSWVGEFNPGKCPLEALRVVADLRCRGLSVCLIMAGDGPLLAATKAACAEWGLQSVCWFVGSVDWIPDLLAGSRVFIMTSLREGLPRAMMEAMAAGLPVVAYAIRGVRDLVQDGINGRLVPPGEVKQMADAVAELVLKPDVAHRMGNVGRVTIQEGFSLEAVMSRMMPVYTETAAIAAKRRIQ
jgi:glycosyltransferase involved in cell wall biosynthesis